MNMTQLSFRYEMTRDCYISGLEYLLRQRRKNWTAIAQFLLFTVVQMAVCAVIVLADGAVTSADWLLMALSTVVCGVQILLRHAARYKAELTCRHLETCGRLSADAWKPRSFLLRDGIIHICIGQQESNYPLNSLREISHFKNVCILIFANGAMEPLPLTAGPANLEEILFAGAVAEEKAARDNDYVEKAVVTMPLWTDRQGCSKAHMVAVRRRYGSRDYWKQVLLRRAVITLLAVAALLLTASSTMRWILIIAVVMLNVEYVVAFSPLLRLWADRAAENLFAIFPSERSFAAVTESGICLHGPENTLDIPWSDLAGWRCEKNILMLYLKNTAIFTFPLKAEMEEVVCGVLRCHKSEQQ